MKLGKVEKQLPSAQVNVTLPGRLKLELDGYAAYYQQTDRRDRAQLRRVRSRVSGMAQAPFQPRRRHERRPRPSGGAVRWCMSRRSRFSVASVDALRAFQAVTRHSSPDEGVFAEKVGKHNDFSEIGRAAGGEENG